jgi:hypothetical protein
MTFSSHSRAVKNLMHKINVALFFYVGASQAQIKERDLLYCGKRRKNAFAFICVAEAWQFQHIQEGELLISGTIK